MDCASHLFPIAHVTVDNQGGSAFMARNRVSIQRISFRRIPIGPYREIPIAFGTIQNLVAIILVIIVNCLQSGLLFGDQGQLPLHLHMTANFRLCRRDNTINLLRGAAFRDLYPLPGTSSSENHCQKDRVRFPINRSFLVATEIRYKWEI